jgi:multiple sugar transport system permease protein
VLLRRGSAQQSAAVVLGARFGARQDRRRIDLRSMGFLAPAGILMVLLFLAPIGYALWLAFTNLQLVGPHALVYSFTGLSNLRQLVSDHEFGNALTLTVIFVVGSSILGQTILGLVLAMAMRRALTVVRLSFGAVLILAWVLPEVTAAFVWYAFGQSGGTLGHITGSPSTDYLVSQPMLTVSLANMWRSVAFSMLMFSAALRNIPTEVIEATEIEGASALRRTFSVVLPMLRGTILTNLLLVTLANISDFTLIWVMTQGGPGDATSTLPVYMYLVSFTYNSLGYGAIIGLAILFVAALFSIAYVRTLRAALR